jgi:hypothetical protein
MSINGITNPPGTLGPLARPETSRTGTDRANGNATAQTHANSQAIANASARSALKPQTPIAGASAQSTVPAEAPAGTDPSLWSVLTTEERNFFAKTAAMGPLTYGRIKAATAQTPPAARGVRLDVRA